MFYVFHGDDEHSIGKTLANLQAKLGEPSLLDLNTTRFEGTSLTYPALRHACDSVPFLGDKRLVIIHNLLAGDPPFMEELLAYLPDLPETTRLVFVEPRLLPASHPLIKLAKAEKKGYVKSFTRPEGPGLEKWVRQRVEEAGGRIEPRAVHMLAVNVGNNLALLENEIEKLVLYKAGHPIEAADVTLLCPYVAEASIFELVDALGSRHGRNAAKLLQKKLNEGTDPFYLFAMIVRQFRLLIQVKELAEAGGRPADIAHTLQLHTFVAGKIYQQCHNYSMDQLEQIYAHLLEMDVGVKTGRTDMITALDLFAAGVSI